MSRDGWVAACRLPAMLVAIMASSLLAQGPDSSPGVPPQDPKAPARPDYRVAERSEVTPSQAACAVPGRQCQRASADARPALGPRGPGNIEKIQDYSATLVKRERIGGKLIDYEYMFVKIRHKPFSVYMYFLGPADAQGPGSDLRRRPEQRQHVGPRRGHQEDHVRHRVAEARRRRSPCTASAIR